MKEAINQNDFTLNERLGLFVHEGRPEIDYSDSSEDYLLDLFLGTDHVSSYPVEMQQHIKDWPTRYHLSHMRTNLLESVKELFNPASKVLELGAGMGALTLWLCDHFMHVDVVEGSLRRAQALRARVKDRKNLRVFVGDISDIKFTEKYDLITLVGVLEYLPFYSQDDPRTVCINFFKGLMGCLNKDGILLISIENKLGAKYFSGCHEDHTGKLFDGIMDYPYKSPVTFSRNEMKEILHESGITQVQFYHLFPDYKLPKVVFKETQNSDYSTVRGWIKGCFEDRSGERSFFFHDTLFIETLIKSKLLHHFSNSFLIVSSMSDKTNLDTSFLIKKFWNSENTKPVFHHTTSLVIENEKCMVLREPFEKGTNSLDGENIEYRLVARDERVEGDILSIEIHKSVFRNDNYVSLVRLLKVVLEKLINNYYCGELDDRGYQIVSGEAVDYCYWNLIRTKSQELCFIDRKWKYRHNLSSDFVIFRNVFYLYDEIHHFIDEKDSQSFVLRIMRNIFPRYDLERYSDNVGQEALFQNEVSITPFTVLNEATGANKKSYLTGIQALEKELQQIHNSRGWRLLSIYYKARDFMLKKITRKDT